MNKPRRNLITLNKLTYNTVGFKASNILYKHTIFLAKQKIKLNEFVKLKLL